MIQNSRGKCPAAVCCFIRRSQGDTNAGSQGDANAGIESAVLLPDSPGRELAVSTPSVTS